MRLSKSSASETSGLEKQNFIRVHFRGLQDCSSWIPHRQSHASEGLLKDDEIAGDCFLLSPAALTKALKE